MTYLYIKAFHLFFVVSWFAGLFYLPRLYVNLALAEPGKEYDRLLLMAFKLFRFMTPLAVSGRPSTCPVSCAKAVNRSG